MFEVIPLPLYHCFSGINVLEKDQKGRTALDLIDDHKSKQKAYAEIKNAIIGEYFKNIFLYLEIESITDIILGNFTKKNSCFPILSSVYKDSKQQHNQLGINKPPRGKPTMWFLNRSDTNRPVQAKNRARSLKFRI